MKKLIIPAALSGILFLVGCSTNQQGAEAYYNAQIANRKPLVSITGVDGEPAKMEFGSMEIYSEEGLAQFQEDDRAIRAIEAGVDGVLGVAGIVEAGRAIDKISSNSNQTTVVRPEVVQPEVIDVPTEVVKPEVVEVPSSSTSSQ
jgi:outer membrane murein-binding lipoprotein Lpp